MKISHNWLQTFFEKPIPTAQELSGLFTFHFSEIEGIEEIKNGKGEITDRVLDVKILPDRAHYALSYLGIAEEIAVLTKTAFKASRFHPSIPATIDTEIKATVEDPNFCRRFTGRYVKNISVGEAPQWMRDFLTAMGGRSISNIVDATNICMFDIGQPLHAFDADKIQGNIVIRQAKEGEKLTLLDGTEITLTVKDGVIADDAGPLDIAGVKGGKRAEISATTKNILLTSCNFNPAAIRRSATRYNLRNEASKRFENEITPELALPGLNHISATVKEICPGAEFGPITDIYPVKAIQTVINIDPDYISERLGVEISRDEMKDILITGLGIEMVLDEYDWRLTIPFRRLDLTIPEDIVEEVGRIHGYNKIKGILPPSSGKPIIPLTSFYLTEKIKNILVSAGFSEVMLYSLVAKGDIAMARPLASDKAFARTTLADNMMKCLEKNALNADILGLDAIKIFEIGKIFTSEKESLMLSIGVSHVKKIKGKKSEDVIKEAVALLEKELAITLPIPKPSVVGTHAVIEIDLDTLLYGLPKDASYADLNFGKAPEIRYEPFSLYPFIVRDIALFVPESVSETDVWNEIKKGISASKADNLLARHALFDVFKKEGKVSYAFRLVFQSMNETLTNEKVNEIMEKVYEGLKGKGWEVR